MLLTLSHAFCEDLKDGDACFPLHERSPLPSVHLDVPIQLPVDGLPAESGSNGALVRDRSCKGPPLDVCSGVLLCDPRRPGSLTGHRPPLIAGGGA